jgi:hypothetical protein
MCSSEDVEVQTSALKPGNHNYLIFTLVREMCSSVDVEVQTSAPKLKQSFIS